MPRFAGRFAGLMGLCVLASYLPLLICLPIAYADGGMMHAYFDEGMPRPYLAVPPILYIVTGKSSPRSELAIVALYYTVLLVLAWRFEASRIAWIVIPTVILGVAIAEMFLIAIVALSAGC